MPSKHRVLLAPVEKVRIRNTHRVDALFRRSLIEYGESIGLRIGKWSQQNAVGKTEDRRVRADAESQSQHDDDRESVTLEQHAQAVRNIAHEILDESNAACIAAFFFRLFDATRTISVPRNVRLPELMPFLMFRSMSRSR